MRSQQFDDIYFSAEDGLAETMHTFIGGNDLPAAWAGKAQFCICETGFGTGLNMLAAWRLFEQTAQPGQHLDLVSIEKYPLSAAQIREALAPWALQPQLDRLLACYPLRVRGFHRLALSPAVTLTLIFDDVHEALPRLSARVDAWFLDGFAPAKNPEMWSDALYAQMARLSQPGAGVATFTAAGMVRRGLAAAGFAVEKRPGFGRKRDMVVGRFHGWAADDPIVRPGKVAIIGAGLAGLSAAWHLRRAGCEVVVYDSAGLAGGASGNHAGLINPKLTAKRSAQGDYYTSAYAYALRVADELECVLAPCGSLHLQNDGDKARRFAAYVDALGWDATHMRMLDAEAASDVAGVRLDVPAMHYPDAVVASPRGLCAALAQDFEIMRRDVTALAEVEADAVVVANAHAVGQFSDLPVQRVRGQVSRVRPGVASANMRAALCYGGYLTPVLADGLQTCGATFQPWDADASVRVDDHARNLAQASAAIPALGQDMQAVDGWTGFRAASRDRFPIVGRCGDVWLSVAHGSHGMMSGVMAGAIIADGITGRVAPVAADSLAALDAARFPVRADG